MRLGEQVRSEEEMECDEEGRCDLTLQDRKVSQIVLHQLYQGDHGQTFSNNVEQLYSFNLEGKTLNNIAIIKLEEKLQETDYVSPICINLRVGFEAEYQTLNIELNIIFKPPNVTNFQDLQISGWKGSRSLHYKKVWMMAGCESDDNLCVTTSTTLEKVNHASRKDCPAVLTSLPPQDTLDCQTENGNGLINNQPSAFGPQWFLLGLGSSHCLDSVRFYTNLNKYNKWILDTITSMI